MALTQEQIKEMDELTGLTTKGIQTNRLSQLQGMVQEREAAQPEKRTFMEKVADFTGGKQIAQGLGQAIANPKIAKQQEQALNDAINQQTELLKRKKEIEALGGDTTAIDRGLAYNKEALDELGGSLEGLLNQKKITGKQVLGSALQLGTTIAGAGTLPSGITGAKYAGVLGKVPGLTKGVPTVVSGVSKATTAGQGALAGLKAGATSGAIYGGASGLAGGLQEDKNALEIAQQGIGGALTGAAVGGALGAATGAIAGKVQGIKITQAKKDKDYFQDLVMPKSTTQEKILAQEQGRVSKAGIIKKSSIIPNKYDEENAEIIKSVVKPNSHPQDAINSINSEIEDISTGVKAYVKKNKVPFNTAQLSKKLDLGKDKLKLIFAGDKQAEKTYKAVKDELMRNIKGKDTAGLLDARQDFDQIPAVRALLESEKLGENTKKKVVLEVRRAANEYIADLLPDGNIYKDALLKDTRLYNVRLNIAEKNLDRLDRNTIQYLVKKYPWLKTAGYLALTGAGLGIGIGGIGAATGRGE